MTEPSINPRRKSHKTKIIAVLLITWSLSFEGLVDAEAIPQPQEITFTARSDNSSQRYLLLLPQEFKATGSHDLLIALHGHGSDRHQFMGRSREETRAVLDIAAKHKLILVSPDYRAPTSWMGPKAETDLTQIIEELKKQYNIGHTILAGASMGGTSALTYAVLHPDSVAGVVSMNGTANHLEYENFQEAIQASFGGSKNELLIEYKLRSAEYWPEKLTMPIAITAGGRDSIVPPASVVRLGTLLQKLHRRILVLYRENGGHETTYPDAVEALEFVIKALVPKSIGSDGGSGASGDPAPLSALKRRSQ